MKMPIGGWYVTMESGFESGPIVEAFKSYFKEYADDVESFAVDGNSLCVATTIPHLFEAFPYFGAFQEGVSHMWAIDSTKIEAYRKQAVANAPTAALRIEASGDNAKPTPASSGRQPAQ